MSTDTDRVAARALGSHRDPTGDPGFIACVGAVLFGAGATLALASLKLPHPSELNELGITVTASAAYLVCALLLVWRERLSLKALQVANGCGTLLVTSCIYFTGSSTSAYVLLYIWAGLYAFYFFPLRIALLQSALIATAYALVPADDHQMWWLLVTGTVVVTGGMIVVLRNRVARLIEQLQAAAQTDVLTGLLNRGGFRKAFDVELERTRRNGLGLSLALGDLDSFKAVNDTGGHQAGDEALKTVAQVLAAGVRPVDVLGRIGGEEFAILFPEARKEDAYLVAERLRNALAAEFANAPVPLSISFGIAAFREHGQTAGALLRAADEALYMAKHLGEDRTVIHSAEVVFLSEARLGRQGENQRYLGTLLELAEAVDLRYYGSARHSETVGRYAEMMASELGMPAPKVEKVRLAGLLHDVGKICVPASIVLKPGKPTREEWLELRRHPEHAARILEQAGLDDVREWVLAHHERPDGTGYPRDLKGEDIPVEARILAVADAYEAMTSERPYQSAMNPCQAQQELVRCAGTQFDALVVHAFVRALAHLNESHQPSFARSAERVAS